MKFTVGKTEVSIYPKAVSDPPKFYDLIKWTSGMAIDCDGSPRAYAPEGSGLPALDYLANAGHPGNWWGIVTNTGNSSGTPVIQDADDEAPGYYVSPTALCDPGYKVRDPRRYVNASLIPYIAVPPELIHRGVHMGDLAFVTHGDKSSSAVVADVGPHGKIGEGSPALAKALGINPDAKKGGTDFGVVYYVFVDSRRGWPRANGIVDTFAREYFNKISGLT